MREIIIHGKTRVEVSEYIFRSWAGERFLDGRPYLGPVYYLGENEVSRPAKPGYESELEDSLCTRKK